MARPKNIFIALEAFEKDSRLKNLSEDIKSTYKSFIEEIWFAAEIGKITEAQYTKHALQAYLKSTNETDFNLYINNTLAELGSGAPAPEMTGAPDTDFNLLDTDFNLPGPGGELSYQKPDALMDKINNPQSKTKFYIIGGALAFILFLTYLLTKKNKK